MYKSYAEDYFIRIGDGHRNAVQRPDNMNVDRSLRCMIERANNNGDCIISGDNGYYRPIPTDPADSAEYKKYMAQERKRVTSLLLKLESMAVAYRSRRAESGKQKQPSERSQRRKRASQQAP